MDPIRLVARSARGALALAFLLCGTSLAQTTWYVDAAAAPGGHGTLASPFQTIRDGIAASASGDVVLVADEVYTGPGNRNLDFGGRAIKVASLNGLGSCIIDCQSAGRAFEFFHQETPAAIVQGFTILNGSAAAGTPALGLEHGGGILVLQSHPTIVDCKLINCAADLDSGQGGALSFTDSSSYIARCEIVGSTAHEGAGVAITHTSSFFGLGAIFFNCLIDSNFSTGNGGGFHVRGPMAFVLPFREPIITHCRLFLNASGGDGGAVYAEGDLLIANSLLGGNRGTQGGAIGAQGDLIVDNCTLVENSAKVQGGGAWFGGGSQSVLANSILWENHGVGLGEQLALSNVETYLVVANCDVMRGILAIAVPGPNSLNMPAHSNTKSDPWFVDPAGPDGDPLTFFDNDYRLKKGSPCNDSGTIYWVPPDRLDLDNDGNQTEPVPFDLAFAPRFQDDPAAPNVGLGTPPIVDMGAYEWQP